MPLPFPGLPPAGLGTKHGTSNNPQPSPAGKLTGHEQASGNQSVVWLYPFAISLAGQGTAQAAWTGCRRAGVPGADVLLAPARSSHPHTLTLKFSARPVLRLGCPLYTQQQLATLYISN